MTESGSGLKVSLDRGNYVSFDKKRGCVTSWKAGGNELIAGRDGPKVDLWRAMIDNDRQGWGGMDKKYVEPCDFGDMLERVIHPSDSDGRIGGKGAGLFLAERILRRAAAASFGPRGRSAISGGLSPPAGRRKQLPWHCRQLTADAARI